jgi:hypothetical protein
MTHICSCDWVPDRHFLVGACEDTVGSQAAVYVGGVGGSGWTDRVTFRMCLFCSVCGMGC